MKATLHNGQVNSGYLFNMDKNNYTVYKHTFPNGKTYIGITSLSVQKRWANGLGYKKTNLVGKAIRRYGWGNIKHEVLFTNLTKEQAIQEFVEVVDKTQKQIDKIKNMQVVKIYES